MSRALLFIADPIDSFRTYKDSTFAMMRAARLQGFEVWACQPQDLQLLGSEVSVAALNIELTGETPRWYSVLAEETRSAKQFSAIIMRKDPPFDMEYFYSTFVLQRAQQQGVLVLNDPAALRDHNEKLAITEFSQFVAPTLVTRSPTALREFVIEHRHAIFKLLDGMGGASIFRADAHDPNLSVIIETMNQFGARTVMAQRYLPAISAGDKRILLIDGRVIPFCLARIPKAGESRGNLAAGGTGVVQALSARDHEIASTLAPILAARGLFVVGLDVIGDCLTEINVTSPTCFQEITQGSGFDVAALFIERLTLRLQSR